MNSTHKDNQKGFTIIEVVLVLAIAGLIFLMVFIALPSLQRNQRDSQRRNDLSRVQTAVNNYQTNNRGTLPTFTGTAGATFMNSYLKSGGDSFVDPNGTNYSFSSTLPSSFVPDTRAIVATKGAACGATEGALLTNQGTRKVALQMRLEGGGVACVSN